MAVITSNREYNRPRKELEVKEEKNVFFTYKRREERLKNERQREDRINYR